MSIELFDDDIELWKEEFSSEPWKVISNDDVRCSCRLPLRISYEYLDMGSTKKEMAAEEKGIRSPRVYFMQGLYGVIYPLFFDPYHEITK